MSMELDHRLLARLRALPFEARVPMQGAVAGRHRSPHRGSSVEFAEYRHYVPGDDTRRLDWKAFARTDRFFVKEFEADTNLRAYFVVDVSGSMAFGNRGRVKLEMARQIVAHLAYLLVNQGDAAGLSLCGQGLHVEIPPRRQASHLQRIFQQLELAQCGGGTGLTSALHVVAEKVAQRALVVVLSDFFCDLDELQQALQHLRHRKHDVCLFQLLDPQEIDFELERPLRFVDLEDGTSVVTEPSLIATEYRAAVQEFLRRVAALCHRTQMDHWLVRTDVGLEPLLRDFLMQRLQKQGGKTA